MPLKNRQRSFMVAVAILLSAGANNASPAQTMPLSGTITQQQDAGTLTTSPADIPSEDQGGFQGRGAHPLEEVRLENPEAIRLQAPESERFLVETITVEGAELIDSEVIQAHTRPYENQQLTLGELNVLAEKIQDLYRQEGYYTAIVYIPPQDVSTGQAIIRVAEGRIGQIRIRGNKYYRSKIVARALHQEPEEPFNLRTLERSLNTSNRHNPFKLRAVLAAGEATGETDIEIEVRERFPLQITTLYNNQGRPMIGQHRGGVSLRHDSLTGNNDRLSLQLMGSTGTKIGLASYSLPINGHGTEISLSTAISKVDVDLGIKNQPELIGKAYNYGLTVSQPLDRERNWQVDAGFNWWRTSSFFDDDQTSETNIRSLQTGINFNRYDQWGRSFARAQTTFGLDKFGGDGEFRKHEMFLNRIFILPKRNMLILRAYGQLTSDPLPTPEQMQIGGSFNVRGYTEGVLIGDRGFTVGLEHRWPIPFLNRINPWLDERIQGAWFVDAGGVWLDDDNRTVAFPNGERNMALLGAGGGLRFQLTRFAEGFVDVACGILGRKDNVESSSAQPTARVHFGVRTNLFPEKYEMRGDETTVLTGRNDPAVVLPATMSLAK